MTAADPAPDLAQLDESLAALPITIAQAPSGMLTVFSECEPRFCFDVTSIGEAEELVARTMSSYARVRHGARRDVRAKAVITGEIVPLEVVRPAGQFRVEAVRTAHGFSNEARGSTGSFSVVSGLKVSVSASNVSSDAGRANDAFSLRRDA